ncbi:MAG: imidazole glycerol phosphate synthase subunit HisH [Actinomycetota bacterium]
MIAILDYGSGNLRSAQRACETTNHEVIITADPVVALSADGLVVPGVGAFGACMEGLLAIGGDEIIRSRIEAKKKVLGICVGMQILFESSEENYQNSEPEGLGIAPGKVVKIDAPIVPHIGWNAVVAPDHSTLFKGIENERFYFVHSYAALTTSSEFTSTTATYGTEFLAAFESENLSAVQFHPEKSGAAGLRLIENWARTL